MSRAPQSASWPATLARSVGCFAAALLICQSLPAVVAVAAEWDPQHLIQLRSRGNFPAAEDYCQKCLADPQLSDAARFELSLELARTLADHAAQSPPAAQAPLWYQARQVLDEYAARHAAHPRLVLVRMQQALAVVAEGETRRAVAQLDPAASFDDARRVLKNAIAQLRALNETVTTEVEHRGRTQARTAADPSGGLSLAEWSSLQLNVRHQLARALKNQGLAYPAGSADRTSALAQAVEWLTQPGQQDSQTVLAWSCRVDEVTCRRLQGRLDEAQQRLERCLRENPPEPAASRLRAESIELALAHGQLIDAVSNADRGAGESPPLEFRLAALDAYLSAWQRAEKARDSADLARYERAALEQLAAIDRAGVLVAIYQAESRIEQTIGSSPLAGVGVLLREAQAQYRSGQIDPALAAYDRASERAAQTREQALQFDTAFTAATIEKERQHFRAAADRYRKLSLAMPTHIQAAEAHLLAVFCAAQLAQQQTPVNLDEYEAMLREHVAAWPSHDTSAQAWVWLGRLLEHRQDHNGAIRALRHVPPEHEQFAQAIEVMGLATTAQLAAAREAGKPDVALAHDAASYFEQMIASQTAREPRWTPSSRAALLALAPILLQDSPQNAKKCEPLIRAALQQSADAPESWRAAAARWLMLAVAADGRMAEAQQLLAQSPAADGPTAVWLADELAALVRAASVERQGPLARFAVAALERDAGSVQLEPDQKLHLQRLQVSLLAAADRRADALQLVESLALHDPREGALQEEWAQLLSDDPAAPSQQLASAKWREIISKTRPGSPRWLRAHLGLARTQQRLGEPRQALATISQAQRQQPDLGGAELQAQFQQLADQCGPPPPASSAPR